MRENGGSSRALSTIEIRPDDVRDEIDLCFIGALKAQTGVHRPIPHPARVDHPAADGPNRVLEVDEVHGHVLGEMKSLDSSRIPPTLTSSATPINSDSMPPDSSNCV